MIVRAKNWRGTAIRAIQGTRGLSGCRRGVGDINLSNSPWLSTPAGPGPAFGPDIFSAADLAALVPEVGPNQNAAGTPVSSDVIPTGTYSVNASGQLQQNIISGISNQALIYGGLAALGFVVLLGMMKGGRR